MRLAIIADTRHHLDAEGRLCALEPVAAQIDVWASLFDEVLMLAPLDAGPPPPTFVPYRSCNIRIEPVPRAGGTGLRDKASLVPASARWWMRIRRATKRVDAVHFRSPCNIALVGIVALWRRRSLHRYAIYAGVWWAYAGEPWSYRLQRWLLRRRDFGGVATIYGAPDSGRPHLVPFYSPSFTTDEWQAEASSVESKLRRLGSTGLQPLRLVTVGRLSRNKDQGTIVRALARLRSSGIDATLEIVGGGSMRAELEALADDLGVTPHTAFLGECDRTAVWEAYRRADLNVLATRQEGFGKVLLEGMATGTPPVVSSSPTSLEITGRGSRGMTFSAGDPESLSSVLCALAALPSKVIDFVMEGRHYAGQRTLEDFRRDLAQLLEHHWGVGDLASTIEGGTGCR